MCVHRLCICVYTNQLVSLDTARFAICVCASLCVCVLFVCACRYRPKPRSGQTDARPPQPRGCSRNKTLGQDHPCEHTHTYTQRDRHADRQTPESDDDGSAEKLSEQGLLDARRHEPRPRERARHLCGCDTMRKTRGAPRYHAGAAPHTHHGPTLSPYVICHMCRAAMAQLRNPVAQPSWPGQLHVPRRGDRKGERRRRGQHTHDHGGYRHPPHSHVFARPVDPAVVKMGAVIFFRVGSGTLEERHCTIRPLRVKPCCCCVPKPVDHARGGAAGAREHCSCVFLSASAVPRRRALAERERGSAHDDSLQNARTLAAVVRLLHARPIVQLAAGSV